MQTTKTLNKVTGTLTFFALLLTLSVQTAYANNALKDMYNGIANYTQFGDAEKFTELKQKRLILQDSIAILNSALTKLNEKLGLGEYQYLSGDSASMAQKITELNAELKNKTLDKDSLLSIKYSLGYLNYQLPRLIEKNKIEKEQNLISTRLDIKHHELSEVETKIEQILTPELARQSFMTWISLMFVALIGLLMVRFFGLLRNDEGLRDKIFGSQTGIQFITLFSIVIAIILFGIIGVLEGKELSALLGAISGYILGRVSDNKPTAPSNDAPATVTPPVVVPPVVSPPVTDIPIIK